MIKKFFSYYKPHKKLFIIDIICSFIYSALSLAYPFLARIIADKYIVDKNLAMILVLCGTLLFIYILRAIFSFIINYWGHILGLRIQADMRTKLFKHLESLPFSYYDENKTGSIMSRITNDLFEIAELAHHGPEDTFISLITLLGSLGILIYYNWALALIVFAVIPFIVAFAIIRRKKMLAAFKASREKMAEINAGVESSISGIRVTKAYAAQENELEKFEKTNVAFKSVRKEAYRNMGIFHSGTGLLINILHLVTLLASALFYIKDLITWGEFMAFLLYIGVMISPIQTLINIYEQIQDGMTGFSRYLEILAVKPETEPQNPVDINILNGDIKFNNVTFSYKSKENEGVTKVIKNLSLTINEGKTVAFVGPSGGGKTTLCHLIPRFYEVDEGTITIGGLDIAQINRQTLRKNVGIVAQDVFLFGGTIKENIAYGSDGATDDEVIEAAKKANIHDFVMSLPDKYESQVGERGVKLSGGQKQRISIARAFLKNPPVLILDEATSALDNVTEMQIQSSLEQLSKGRTTIIVAHRLSTIKNSDEIMVLTADGIAERGNHNQLMEQNGFYAHLYSFYSE